MDALEEYDDPQEDELLRLSQGDLYTMKRNHIGDIQEKHKLYQEMLDKEDAVLRKARLQVTEGKVIGTGPQLYFDDRMMSLHRRRLSNMQMDIHFEEMEMLSRRELKEDEETRGKRRAKQFKLAEYDESEGFPEELGEIPDEIEYGPTHVTPESFEEKMDMELKLIEERIDTRSTGLQQDWSERWMQEGATKDQRSNLSLWTRLLKRYPKLRQRWTDDDRCWREPVEWHEHYTASTASRLTDGVVIPNGLVEKAEMTALELWSDAPRISEEEEADLHHISNLFSPPSITPSIWTYPGNLVCLMNRRGALDIYRRHELDRDVWWVGRLSLAKDFLDKIDPGMDLSAVEVGQHHLAIFSFQRFFMPTKLPRPFGACWMVPKAELAQGSNVTRLPHVPLHYYTPISAKGTLFVLGYNDSRDRFYKLLSLKWDGASPSEWVETEMSHSLPIVWTENAEIKDYPESIHLMGTASMCVAQDESAIFITAPTTEGQVILTINTTTWDFHVDQCAIPPVWGCSLIHDEIRQRLILAGGIGYMAPEPIVRYFNLLDSTWSVQATSNKLPLPAYGISFPIGYGSHAIVGGFWRTGHKKFNLQPTASIFALHTSPGLEFQEESLYRMYSGQYGEEVAPKEGDQAESQAESQAEDEEPEFES